MPGIALGKLRTGSDRFELPLADAKAEALRALSQMKVDLQGRSQALKERLTFRIHSREDFDARLKVGRRWFCGAGREEREPGMMLVPWGGDDDDEAVARSISVGASIVQ